MVSLNHVMGSGLAALALRKTFAIFAHSFAAMANSTGTSPASRRGRMPAFGAPRATALSAYPAQMTGMTVKSVSLLGLTTSR